MGFWSPKIFLIQTKFMALIFQFILLETCEGFEVNLFVNTFGNLPKIMFTSISDIPQPTTQLNNQLK